MVLEVPAISPTERRVASSITAICLAISSVALEVWVASIFTSEATTAKPRPASPARAASMVALSASRLVCEAICEIRPTTEPIFSTASESDWMLVLACSAEATAACEVFALVAAWWWISEIEAVSSPVAVAISPARTTVSPAALAALLVSAEGVVSQEPAARARYRRAN